MIVPTMTPGGSLFRIVATRNYGGVNKLTYYGPFFTVAQVKAAVRILRSNQAVFNEEQVALDTGITMTMSLSFERTSAITWGAVPDPT